MSSLQDWTVPPGQQPKPGNYAFNLEQALTCIVGVSARVPGDAFTASTLGTERAGNGVVIRNDGLVLTIGYLVTEAEAVWLRFGDGQLVQGDVLGYDQETGFGLIQALARLDVPAMPFGRSSEAQVGESVIIGGAGGRPHSVAAQIVAKQEFAGYWEYLLDEALFCAPAHPNWGGTALIGAQGDLLGIGSLHLEQGKDKSSTEHINMIVPIDLLKPILDDMMTLGRPNRPPRPWLGLQVAEVESQLVVIGFSGRGPAVNAGLETGDIILSVAGAEVHGLSGLYRRIWSLGAAGIEVPFLIHRDGRRREVKIQSADRRRFFKMPRLH
ncbi:MAG TPA: S1C family serine protease [Beijerinckiaceae bacterium]|jgi:S1-C subfamily serine protease|nr:S1C family serine protease [Beijerinckiaceae bacterium]